MKRNWLLVGAMGVALFACQSKNDVPPPAPPQAPSEDKVRCREDECDEEEAGEEAMIEGAPCKKDKYNAQEAEEEAMIHVIEIGEPDEQKNAAVEATPSIPESVPANEQKSAAVETAPSNNVSAASTESKLHSQEASESVEMNRETPPMTEEPTTQIFEDFPNSPISENTVVLSLEE